MLGGARVPQNWVTTVNMEANQYQAIKHFVSTSEYPKWIKTAGEKSKWRQKTKRIMLVGGQLFHEEKKASQR